MQQKSNLSKFEDFLRDGLVYNPKYSLLHEILEKSSDNPIPEKKYPSELPESSVQALRLASTTTFPEGRLLSFLHKSSVLALRRVSTTTKNWVESGPQSVFSTLYLPFPFKSQEYNMNPDVPSYQASKVCEKLIVNVAASSTRLKAMYNIFLDIRSLPRYSSLMHLHVNAPASDSFWPLLEFRMFIQAVKFRRLRRFTVNGLSIEGIKALRWGPLTSYLEADWASSAIWQRLTNLDVSLVPSMGVPNLGRSEEGRQAIKILHDWIRSFGENRFEKVRFEWIGDQEGPNPFLLDEMAELHGPDGEPQVEWINWKSCKEIWLGGVSLGTKDLEKMMDRVKGLKKLVIWTSLLGREMREGERKVYSRGHEWVMIDTDDMRENQTDLTTTHVTRNSYLTETALQSYLETLLQDSQAQILEDWSREDKGEERGGGKTPIDEDNDDALSTGSREVPIFLECF